MVDSLYPDACCRLNERFPALRWLWLHLWRAAVRCGIAAVISPALPAPSQPQRTGLG